MANVLGGSKEDLYPEVGKILGQDPSLRVHLYGKQVRPGRKIGHVTVCGEDLRDLRQRARRAADQLRGASQGATPPTVQSSGSGWAATATGRARNCKPHAPQRTEERTVGKE